MSYYRTRLRRASRQLRLLPAALRLVWQAAPGWTVVWVLLLVVQGILPVCLVFITRAVVDAMVAVTSSGLTPSSAGPVVGVVLLAGGIMLLNEVLGTAAKVVRVHQAERITDHVSALLQARSVSVDLAFYDVPASYDHLHRARNEAHQRPLILLESMGSLLQNGITLVAMMLVILPYGGWLPVALLLSTVPAMAAVLRGTRRYHQWFVRTTADQRRAWYLDWMTTNREAAAELRLFQLGPHLQAQYVEVRARLRTEREALAWSEARVELVASALSLTITAATMGILLWQTLDRKLSLGDMAMLFQAFSQGQSLMRQLLGHVGQIYSNSLFLEDLMAFLALEPQIKDPEEPLPAMTPGSPAPTVRFRDVTFGYAGERGPVLQDFNLTLPAGRTVALVGRNGSGKTTLVKLLCRFYDPLAGAIEIGGMDLRHMAQVELRRLITVLFQAPVDYHATVHENIAMADLAAPASAVREAARLGGADELIRELPHGYETLLGVWFPGGTDLSVGEWQRIALARAYLRQSPIMVLDEPTSAMDPWAEAEWFQRFRGVARGRTVLLITHRFTTARFADLIYVMDDGAVVEAGTHEELLAHGGAYARSWNDQRLELERPTAVADVLA
jgi:ATP-binding cassette subfamily B protein